LPALCLPVAVQAPPRHPLLPAPAAPSSPAAAASDTAHTSASSQQVKNLAKRIEAAQQPEIDQMTAWLKAWNAPVPSAEDRTMGGLAAWDGPQ